MSCGLWVVVLERGEGLLLRRVFIVIQVLASRWRVDVYAIQHRLMLYLHDAMASLQLAYPQRYITLLKGTTLIMSSFQCSSAARHT